MLEIAREGNQWKICDSRCMVALLKERVREIDNIVQDIRQLSTVRGHFLVTKMLHIDLGEHILNLEHCAIYSGVCK